MILPFAVFQLSQYVFGPLLFLLSTFIILLILLQRGRGGGLTGALGGAGGSSALGVKAGDILTRITAFSVLGWIILCAFVCWFYLPAALDIEADAEINNTSGSGTLTAGPGEGARNETAGSAANLSPSTAPETASPATPESEASSNNPPKVELPPPSDPK